MRNLFGLVFLFLCVACSSQDDDKEFKKITDVEKAILKSFQDVPMSANLKMTTDNEPGEKMILCITFVEKTKKTPLKDQKVLFYQTNNKGEYEPQQAGDEQTARIRGVGFTDVEGRLYIQTILPGSYATRGDGRHIHTAVFGAKPEAYDLHFKQYTGSRGRRFIESRDQFFLVDLKYTDDKQLIGFVTIEVKNPK